MHLQPFVLKVLPYIMSALLFYEIKLPSNNTTKNEVWEQLKDHCTDYVIE